MFGQVPIWVYGALSDRCQTAPWIGYFAALEKEAVVVHSRTSTHSPGDVVPIALHRSPCPAILIGGPPDSGKSVLSNALRLSLMKQCPELQVFLHRANWDGEGNWSHQSHNRDLVNRLIREHERRIHEEPKVEELLPKYFHYHAKATANLREVVDLVLVDVGGKAQSEKEILVRQCSHYIVISGDRQRIQEWHDLCQPILNPLAIVHSVREDFLEELRLDPFLELKAGPWNRGETLAVPDVLVQAVLGQLRTGQNPFTPQELESLRNE